MSRGHDREPIPHLVPGDGALDIIRTINQLIDAVSRIQQNIEGLEEQVSYLEEHE